MLHYKIYSQQHKEWVVLVHGAGGSSTIWYKQIRAYRKHFNVLVVDLRGHGACEIENSPTKYTLDLVSQDILGVLDSLDIEKAHFVGISLGTMLIRQLAESNPERFHTMVLAGAVIRITPKLHFLLGLANLFKKIIPFMWLYKLFAWILMPKKTHKSSRNLFIQEAKKIKHREFLRWLTLTGGIAKHLVKINEKDTKITSLYIMGDEDYVFLEPVKRLVKKHSSSQLVILKNCGHVCNVDQAAQFNEVSMQFLANALD
ncbi:alpha/beta hydrolase [Solibacillus sp. MA9]|uniref:Alpha/beta hydrolase n=1 Tax=Solibacillus palustris TaxID=2908203 RepID=A0ABS9UEI8_9BACL|nr:alpha/beta hydrolase [Solibacillus sp. MA9]MCH7322762.1 alpha/beta hydrolase [Solibacillus sp. MA9]